MFRAGMLRQVCRKILAARPSMLMPTATYQNFVMSDALAQIEKDCEKFCPVPRFPPQKDLIVSAISHEDKVRYHSSHNTASLVIDTCSWYPEPDHVAYLPQGTEMVTIKVCVCGAGSDVGRIVSLFLKQQNVVKIMAMYDDYPERYVLGVANDLAHIDTSTEVEAFQGRVFLKAALYDADVVLICGGNYVMPPCCNISDRDLFLQNMQYVRTVTMACAQFCPQAIIAVQTPPVDCNFSLIKHTLELAQCYDKRRLLGVNSINAMRANQLFCSITGSDPKGSNIPVICGTGRCTRVPIFSAGKPGNVPQTQVDCLTRLVREADDIICRVKSNNEQGHLSIGFSTARFILNIMQGLFEKPTFLDSALVEQRDPQKCFEMEYCATPVTIGKGGIVEYAIPTINEAEKTLLESAKCDLEDSINLGRCHALGDEYFIHPDKVGKCIKPPPCEVCEVCQKSSGENK